MLGLSCCFALPSQTATSQTLPKPSRTVFKCEVNGKITYSDEPCLGAKKLKIEPTRGMSPSTAISPAGNDVARENWRESISNAVKPITGLNSKEYSKSANRHGLSSQDLQECRSLDRLIENTEATERTASSSTKPAVQQTLLEQRQRYRTLRC